MIVLGAPNWHSFSGHLLEYCRNGRLDSEGEKHVKTTHLKHQVIFTSGGFVGAGDDQFSPKGTDW